MANSDERAGQPESMEQVIALYYDQIYKFCYWKTHSAVDAQDITQDTFIRFMDAAQTYSDIESPKALLYTIAHHLCLNWLKKCRRILWMNCAGIKSLPRRTLRIMPSGKSTYPPPLPRSPMNSRKFCFYDTGRT